MQLGMIGLGRMGANMVRRLMKRRPRMRGLRQVAKGGWRNWSKRKATGAASLAELVKKLDKAARDLADGARCSGRPDDRRPVAAPRGGRHPYRRRQFVLRRRHPPRQGTRAQGDSLRRRRHQRRRLGSGAWLLHDDRRRKRCRANASIRSSPRWPRAWATFRARPAAKSRRHRRAGLSALRTERRRPFRQNGAQRNRIRHHGGVCGRAGQSCAPPNVGKQTSTRSTLKPRRCAIPNTTNTTSTCATSPRCGGAAA